MNPGSSEIAMSVWQEVAEQMLAEVAAISLGCEQEVKVRACTPPRGMPGAFIAIMGQVNSVYVALISSEDGCQALANQLLGVDPAEKMPQSDIADALGEVLNILAGAIKGRLDSAGNRLSIGFPRFSADPLSEAIAHLPVTASQVRIGAVDAVLLVAPTPCEQTGSTEQQSVKTPV